MEDKNRPAPWLDYDLKDRDGEEWRDVINFDGMYQVSNFGRIKSLRRYAGKRILKERIMRCGKWQHVGLSINGVVYSPLISNLVSDAFIRFKEEGEVVCHKNKIVYDNRLSNLTITDFSTSAKIAYKVGASVNWGIDSVSKKRAEEYFVKFGHFEGENLVALFCMGCNAEKPVSEFYLKGNYVHRKCKSCKLKKSGVVELGKNKDRLELAKSGLRYCSTCKKLKSLDNDFGNSRGAFMGKSNNCKHCVKELNAMYRERKAQLKAKQVTPC
jgi:hypothetical protein